MICLCMFFFTTTRVCHKYFNSWVANLFISSSAGNKKRSRRRRRSSTRIFNFFKSRARLFEIFLKKCQSPKRFLHIRLYRYYCNIVGAKLHCNVRVHILVHHQLVLFKIFLAHSHQPWWPLFPIIYYIWSFTLILRHLKTFLINCFLMRTFLEWIQLFSSLCIFPDPSLITVKSLQKVSKKTSNISMWFKEKLAKHWMNQLFNRSLFYPISKKYKRPPISHLVQNYKITK